MNLDEKLIAIWQKAFDPNRNKSSIPEDLLNNTKQLIEEVETESYKKSDIDNRIESLLKKSYETIRNTKYEILSECCEYPITEAGEFCTNCWEHC